MIQAESMLATNQNRPEVETITWSNILRWARRTFKADRKKYYSAQRPMSLKRISASVWPSLDKPIFLVGSPRSGTTFLGQCLSRLPQLSYHFEPIATKAAARYVSEEIWTYNQAKWFYQNVYQWLLRIHGDGDLRFIEKTPRNSLIVPFLARAFPNAQFIHIIRDGRDVALSLSKKPWFLASQANSGRYEPGGYPYGPYAQFWVEPERREEFESTNDIHRCIWVWKRFTETALQSIGELPSQRYLEIRYESLVNQPELETERLRNFLEINDSSSLNILNQAIKTANPALSAQWKNQLSEQQLTQIYQEAGQLLTSLNYVN